MNFLSHFYFERQANNAEQTLGSILPDLLRNMDRDIHIFPEKEAWKYKYDEKVNSIYYGWCRHLEADRLFHNAIFFIEKTQQIKAYIIPVTLNTPIRPSFLSHITLELLLDRLLLKDSWLHENDFYNQLARVDQDSLVNFLSLSGVQDYAAFLVYFNGFITDRYLGSYRNMEQIAYALDQICKKFWPDGLGHKKKDQLVTALNEYERELAYNYKAIFNEIALHLELHTKTC